MIENGLSTWLADQLVRKSEFVGNRNKYEMYDLEYSLALFMNLCQCQLTARACSSRARNIFKSLSVFISTLDVDVSLHIYIYWRNFKKLLLNAYTYHTCTVLAGIGGLNRLQIHPDFLKSYEKLLEKL